MSDYDEDEVDIRPYDKNRQKRQQGRPKNRNFRGVKLWVIPDDEGNLPELDAEKLKKLKAKAQNYCVWVLSQGDKSRHQLASKMLEKNCPEDIVNGTLDAMEKLKYLSDERFTATFIKNHRHRKIGDTVIKQKLKMAGVDPDVQEACFAELEEKHDPEAIVRELAERRMRNIMRSPKEKRFKKLADFLIRRGHNPGIVFKVVKEIIAEYEDADFSEFDDDDDDDDM